MRIVNLYSRFKTMSGGPVFLTQLAREVVRAGHGFDVLTRAVSDRCRPYFAERVNLVVPRFLGWVTGVQLIDSFLDLCAALLFPFFIPRGVDAVVVHSDAALPALFVRRLLGRRGSAPWIYYCYQPTQFAYNLTWEKARAFAPLGYLIPLLAPLYRAFDRFCGAGADAVIAFSTVYRDRCKTLYGKADTALVAPGVDASFVAGADGARVRAAFGVPASRPVVLTVNKLIVQKNVDVLLRATAELCRAVPDVLTVIVGDGPEKPRLERLRDELGLGGNVLFTGFVRDWSGVCDWYAACNVCVFLERDVPFGMTVLEAGLFGKPCVAVKSGGALDTVDDGRSGFLVPDSLESGRVAECVLRLLSAPDLARKMGQCARERATAYTWGKCAAGFLEVVADAVGRARKGSR